MFRCLLMRHAEAEERAESGLDEDRVLTSAGAENMRAIAMALGAQIEAPDVIASSPFARAVQTASFLAESYGGPEVDTHQLLQPGADPAIVMGWLAGQRATTIIIVGHEPDLGRFASYALAGSVRSFFPMRKGEACLLEFPAVPRAGNATLEWALEPDQLIGLARGLS